MHPARGLLLLTLALPALGQTTQTTDRLLAASEPLSEEAGITLGTRDVIRHPAQMKRAAVGAPVPEDALPSTSGADGWAEASLGARIGVGALGIFSAGLVTMTAGTLCLAYAGALLAPRTSLFLVGGVVGAVFGAIGGGLVGLQGAKAMLRGDKGLFVGYLIAAAVELTVVGLVSGLVGGCGQPGNPCHLSGGLP